MSNTNRLKQFKLTHSSKDTSDTDVLQLSKQLASTLIKTDNHHHHHKQQINSTSSSSAQTSTNTTTSSLKSSVKRLFSPNTSNKNNHHHNQQQQHQSKQESKSITSSAKKSTHHSSSSKHSLHQMSSRAKMINDSDTFNSNDNTSDDSSTVSNLTSNSISAPSLSCSSNSSSLSKKEIQIIKTKPQQQQSHSQHQHQQQHIRSTPTSSLKKHLNILKSNSKKVLLGSSSAVLSSSSSSTNQHQRNTLKSSSSKPNISFISNTSIASQTSLSPDNKQHLYLAQKLSEYELRLKDLNQTIDTTSKAKIKELQAEIERLSRLYDFEISKQSKYEEKMLALKQMAEEKQIESAALKYEYRKVQELKDNLIAENNSLKTILNSLNLNNSPILHQQQSRQSSPCTSNYNSPRLLNTNSCNSQSNKNLNSSFSTAPSTPVVANNLQIQAVQQAAAVAAAAAALNAHTTSQTTTIITNTENGTGSYENNHYNLNHHQHHHHTTSQHQHSSQSYHVNLSRSLSPAPPPPPPLPPSLPPNNNNQNTNQSQNSSSSSLSQANLKQLQYQQQQQQNAMAAASAAAEFYEQQFKLQQHKNLEIEQQFRVHLEQLKELKETINNLNDMNRKLYEENQQFKDRNLEQRQQIEHFHSLFQENQQQTEQQLAQIRKERDDAFARENESKRRMQQTIDSKQHETYLTMTNLKEKLDELKSNESHLINDLNTTRIELQQERNKVDLLEKKCKLLDKDCSLIKEGWSLEKSDFELKINDLSNEIVQVKMQSTYEKQKIEEKSTQERDLLKLQLKELELKLDDLKKDNSQLALKCSQLNETNQELNSLNTNKQTFYDSKIDELKSKVDYYMKRCNELEKEKQEAHENHVKDTEEWKKFQADLQTAVRVANDFMNEAEEKMNKMKEEHMKSKEKEQLLVDEIERLKKKLCSQTNISSTNLRQNKENQDKLTASNSTSSLVRNLIDSIESTNNNVVLMPVQLNNDQVNKIDEKLTLTRNRTTSMDQNNIKLDLNNILMPQSLSTSSISGNITTQMNQTSSDALANLVKQYGVSKRNALIKWCQERLNDYKGIEIKNFSSSWNDGLAFCALMHSYLPHMIDYDTLRIENNSRKNFNAAFMVAQSIGIEANLNAQDLINNERPDWNAVMNYVAEIYKHFQHLNSIKIQQTDDVSKVINSCLINHKLKSTRSSSSSPTALRTSHHKEIPLSMSTSSTESSTGSPFNSASSSSSSISKNIC